MSDREIMLNSIINYIGDHIKLSNESWSFKGIETDGFSATDLLKLIYYVKPSIFEELKVQLQEKEEGNNERVN